MRFDRPSFSDSGGDKPDKDKPSDWFPSKSVSGSELAKRMDRLINEEIAAETGEDVAVVEARFKQRMEEHKAKKLAEAEGRDNPAEAADAADISEPTGPEHIDHGRQEPVGIEGGSRGWDRQRPGDGDKPRETDAEQATRWEPKDKVAAALDYAAKMREWAAQDRAAELAAEQKPKGDRDDTPTDQDSNESDLDREVDDSTERAESDEPAEPEQVEPTDKPETSETEDKPEAAEEAEISDVPKLGDLPPEEFERVVDMLRADLPEWVVPRSGNKTHGRWFNHAGSEISSLLSGQDEMYEAAKQQFVDADGPGRFPYTVSHVETKLAAHMKANGITEASVVINNTPCLARRVGCDTMIPKILPEGSKLTVYGITRDGTETAETYYGKAPR